MGVATIAAPTDTTTLLWTALKDSQGPLDPDWDPRFRSTKQMALN